MQIDLTIDQLHEISLSLSSRQRGILRKLAKLEEKCLSNRGLQDEFTLCTSTLNKIKEILLKC